MMNCKAEKLGIWWPISKYYPTQTVPESNKENNDTLGKLVP
jgi:hypothetical protein